MIISTYSGRNQTSHITDFRLRVKLLCHFVLNRFIESNYIYNKVQIDVHLKKMEGHEFGVTWPEGLEEETIEKINKNHIKIYINSLMLKDEYKFFRTLVHELVHAKQYILKELCYRKHQMCWKGIPSGFVIGEDLRLDAYYDLPWEIEAFGREEGLMVMFNAFWKEFCDSYEKN